MSPRGTIRISPATPTTRSAKPSRMMLLGRCAPAFLPASSATPNIVSESGAIDRPVCIALYSSTICKKIGSAIIIPPSDDLLEQLTRDAEPEQLRPEQIRVDQRGLRVALPVDQPPAERSHGDRADRQERRDGLARLPATPGCPGRGRPCRGRRGSPDHIDVPRSGVRHVPDAADTGEHDGDDHDLEREADAPREERGDEAPQAAVRPRQRSRPRRRPARRPASVPLPRSCRG